MARRLRGNRERPERITPVERNVGTMSYAATQLRGHCPTCGMMANIERFTEAPHEVDAWMQYYGGEIKQHYERAPEYDNDLMRTILAHIDNTRAYLMGELGISKEEAEEIEEPEIEEELTEDQAEDMDALADEAIEEYERGETEDIRDIAEESEPDEEEEESEEGDEFPEWPEGQEEMELDEEEEDE